MHKRGAPANRALREGLGKVRRGSGYEGRPAPSAEQRLVHSSGAKKLLKSANTLYEQINDIDIEEIYGQEVMWDRLEALANLIRQKLKALGRREQ